VAMSGMCTLMWLQSDRALTGKAVSMCSSTRAPTPNTTGTLCPSRSDCLGLQRLLITKTSRGTFDRAHSTRRRKLPAQPCAALEHPSPQEQIHLLLPKPLQHHLPVTAFTTASLSPKFNSTLRASRNVSGRPSIFRIRVNFIFPPRFVNW